jgi:hypothetical protein
VSVCGGCALLASFGGAVIEEGPPGVRCEWELEDRIECWTLDDSDFGLIANRSGATRLGFALSLKYFEQEARFPRHAGELPPIAEEFVGGQVKVDPAVFREYAWSGRTVEYHRAQIRTALGSASRRWAMRTSWRTGWLPRCARPN